MKKYIGFLAVLIFLSLASKGFACENGKSWTFNIEGKNPLVSRSDEVNGIYTVRCENGKPTLDAAYPNHFSVVIPTIPNLTAEPPWFKFLDGSTSWDWEFDWIPPNTRNRRTEKWVAHFRAKVIDSDKTIIVRNDEQISGTGFRKYEYIFSKRFGGVVKMNAEWKNGTTYKLVASGAE